MKETKDASEYVDKSPNPETICGGCRHFEPPNGCEKVQGRINDHGWCKYWAKAKAPNAKVTIQR